MIYTATPLDLLEASTLTTQQGILQVMLKTTTPLHPQTLLEAIKRCCEHVPELACRYDVKRNCFETLSDDGYQRMLQEVSELDFTKWDICTQPQCIIQLKKNTTEVAIGISHILCDGNGACQLLQLLFDYYQGGFSSIQNKRNLATLPTKKQTKHVRKRDKTIALDGKPSSHCHQQYSLHRSIEFTVLHGFAKQHHVTLNSVLLCAYMQAVSELYHQSSLTITCPVNLRAFLIDEPPMTITNFTGDYQVTLHHIHDTPWQTLLSQIHQQMQEERVRNVDLHTISWLYPCSKALPIPVLRKLAQLTFHVPMVSFTNVGDLNAYLCFKHPLISEAMILTSPKQFPNIQVCASSFQGTTSLTCHMIGTSEHYQTVFALLEATMATLVTMIQSS